MPLDESIELDEGKTPSKDIKLKEIIKNATRQAKIDGYDQYIYKDSDGEYSFTRVEDENRKPVGKIEYEPKPHTVGTTKYIQLESKEIKTESVEDKNLANIKACLNQSGIRNPHTVERMAKDVLAILNTYDEDTKDEDGLYYIPAIVYAIQDKVERITGKRPELTIESKEVKTESVTDTEFEDIDSLQDLQEVIENLYEQEKIDDDIYDEVSDYISTRIDEVEKYIEERSKVTNTDEKDIVGIMEDNTLDAIEKVKEIINGKESKEITLDDVLNELGIMKDSPAAEEESSKIKEFMETHPEASLDQIVKAYKNYEETGLFECKEIKIEDHQLHCNDIQEMNESKTKSARDYVYDACKTAWEAGQLDEDLLRYIFEDLEEDNIPYDKEEVTDYFYELLNDREF